MGNIGLGEPNDEYPYPINRSQLISENLVYFPHGGSYDLDMHLVPDVNHSNSNNFSLYQIYREDVITVSSISEKKMYELTKIGTLFSSVAFLTTIFVLPPQMKKFYDWLMNTEKSKKDGENIE